jgi:hypothetical protein
VHQEVLGGERGLFGEAWVDFGGELEQVEREKLFCGALPGQLVV